jgi:hypothetical protein
MRAGKPGRIGVMLVGILTVLPGPALFAQTPGPLIPPDPAPGLGRPVPLAPEQVPSPLTYTLPPPLVPPTNDPGPNGWAPYEPPSSPAGYFVDAEIAVLFPDLHDKITNDVGLTPSGAMLHVPTVSLGVTVSPKFEFGYRLPDSCGFFAVSYRFIAAEGSGDQVFGGAAFATRTRLNLQIADLDYGTAPLEVSPNLKIGYRIGIRLADIFFDSSLSSPTLIQQASNSYLGAGPHGVIDAERRIEAVQGLSLFGRLDGAVLVGQLKQKFHEYAAQPGGTLASDEEFRHTQSVPNLVVQAGVSYVPPILPNLKLTTGYQFEGYFFLGQFNTNGTPGNSRATLYTNSVFLRAEYSF